MKALSLWQPWASAIAIGAKKIETRHWSTNYRGPLLIHAAKRNPGSEVSDQIEGLGLDLNTDDLPFGALIAVADLVGCCNTESLKLTDLERSLGDYSPNRFGWILYGIKAFKQPIPYRGAQGLFNVPDEIVAQEIKEWNGGEIIGSGAYDVA